MANFVCGVCGFTYNEDEQDTAFADLPDDYLCPVCGVGKDKFSEQ